MAAGVGVDIVQIDRFETLLAKTPSFALRFFSERERAFLADSQHAAAFFAGRFAAHEAVLKALGIGFGSGVGCRDVVVVEDDEGRLHVELEGGARARATDLCVTEVALSLSFTGNLVVANALALTEEDRPKPPEEPEKAEVLVTRSFKEARSILDELDLVQDEGLHVVDARAPEQRRQ